MPNMYYCICNRLNCRNILNLPAMWYSGGKKNKTKQFAESSTNYIYCTQSQPMQVFTRLTQKQQKLHTIGDKNLNFSSVWKKVAEMQIRLRLTIFGLVVIFPRQHQKLVDLNYLLPKVTLALGLQKINFSPLLCTVEGQWERWEMPNL